MNRTLLLVLANFLCCVMMIGLMVIDRRSTAPPVTVPPSNPLPPPEIKPPEAPKIQEPKWTSYPPIRQVTHLGKILSDIESHMPENHIYRDSDKITWAHETSHGLCSNIRQKFSSGGYVALNDERLPVFHSADGVNGFYVLKDRAMVLKEPSSTLTAIARAVSQELRGDVYQLYLIKQAGQWNNEPLYVLDEWVAYSNGSATRADLKITNRAETVRYMMEFSCYAIYMLKVANPDQDVKTFVKWHLERCMGIMKENESVGDISAAKAYWEKVKANAELKQFCLDCFGQDWCQKTLGF